MTARALLKTSLSAPLAWSGGASLVGRASGKCQLPLVLGYHRVVENYTYSSSYANPGLLISVKTLVRQLEWISRRYEICALDDLDTRSRSRRSKQVAAITFDDGYADVYRYAFPLLVNKGIPFTVFAATDYVGSDNLFPHDELYLRLKILLSGHQGSASRLGEILNDAGCRKTIADVLPVASSEPYRLTRAMLAAFSQEEIRTVINILCEHTEVPEAIAIQSAVMNWDMLIKMQRTGVLIGCHSKSHAILTNESPTKAFREARDGREVLERRLGVPVRHFAYPDGAFNDKVVRAIGEAGYSHAYTVCFHRSEVAPQLTVPRRMLWERSNVNVMGHFSESVMTCLVNGVFDTRTGCAKVHR